MLHYNNYHCCKIVLLYHYVIYYLHDNFSSTEEAKMKLLVVSALFAAPGISVNKAQRTSKTILK